MTKKRFEIVHPKEGESFLHDTHREYENIPIENINCPALHFLLARANEAPVDKYNMVAVYDWIIGLERSLVLVEKLQDDLRFTAASNVEELPDDLRNRKARAFLMSGNITVEKSIRHMWECLEWIREELGFREVRYTEDCCCASEDVADD